IAGATIYRGRLAKRESSRVALQRCGKSADAVLHSAARRDCFHVLPIRKAAGLLQSTCVPARDGERLCATVNAVADAIRRGVRAKTRSDPSRFHCTIKRTRCGDEQSTQIGCGGACVTRSNQGSPCASGRGSEKQ